MRNWKPGDVALVTWDDASYTMQELGQTDVTTSIALRQEYAWSLPSDGASILDGMATDARPLLVIDPENREDIERLADAVAGYPSSGWVDQMQAALRSLLDPEPEEPTETGWYAYSGGAQSLIFHLRESGQWSVHASSGSAKDCTWGYISQALGVWDLVRIDLPVDES